MRFKKGDPLNLEGKVIIYGKFNPENSVPVEGFVPVAGSDILALYMSDEEGDFRAKIGVKEEDGYFQYIARLKEMQEHAIKQSGFDVPGQIFFRAALPIALEQDLISGDHDLLFVGEFETPMLCVRALSLGADYYSTLVSNQLLRNKSKQKLLKAPAEKIDFLPTHVMYQGASIKETLLHGYVIPMCDAKKFRREQDYQKLEKELLTFCEGSRFESTALELCETISLSIASKTTDLNELYLQKVDLLVQQMNAVHLEDYTFAAETKNKIKELEASITKNAS